MEAHSRGASALRLRGRHAVAYFGPPSDCGDRTSLTGCSPSASRVPATPTSADRRRCIAGYCYKTMCFVAANAKTLELAPPR